MNDIYLKTLKKILANNAAPTPPTKSRPQIEADLAEISGLLRGPLNNVERLDLIEARTELRKQLAILI